MLAAPAAVVRRAVVLPAARRRAAAAGPVRVPAAPAAAARLAVVLPAARREATAAPDPREVGRTAPGVAWRPEEGRRPVAERWTVPAVRGVAVWRVAGLASRAAAPEVEAALPAVEPGSRAAVWTVEVVLRAAEPASAAAWWAAERLPWRRARMVSPAQAVEPERVAAAWLREAGLPWPGVARAVAVRAPAGPVHPGAAAGRADAHRVLSSDAGRLPPALRRGVRPAPGWWADLLRLAAQQIRSLHATARWSKQCQAGWFWSPSLWLVSS